MDIQRLLADCGSLPLPEAARTYAADGVPVFPCVPDGKRPLTSHGFLDASTDAQRIGAWWRRWPSANIGVPTGLVSGFVVVDVDLHPSGSGFKPFADALRAGLVGGWAALVRTPSGGLHAYYSAGTRQQGSWQAGGAHVDFRGAGGYVIAPPSSVSTAAGGARPYVLLETAAAATSVPVDGTRLRAFLDPSRPVLAPGRPVGRGVVDVMRLASWVASRSEGERNRSLFWAACRLAEIGLPADDARAVLGTAGERAGLGAREVATTIRSAYRTTRARSRRPDLPRDAERSRGAGRGRPGICP